MVVILGCRLCVLGVVVSLVLIMLVCSCMGFFCICCAWFGSSVVIGCMGIGVSRSEIIFMLLMFVMCFWFFMSGYVL